MKIKRNPRQICMTLFFIIIVTATFTILSGNVLAYPATYATSNSGTNVYDGPNSSSMIVGSIGVEGVNVFWQGDGYYYIEYTVSNGTYGGYKRGYVPTGTINVSGIGGCTYSAWYSNTNSNQTVYDRPGTNSYVIGTVYSSDSIAIIDEDSGWYYIKYPVSSGCGYKCGYVPKSTVNGVASTGYVDYLNASGIGGWAWQPSSPNTSIDVHIYIYRESDNQYLTSFATSANQYRSDLASLGYGNGYHGFSASIDWLSLPQEYVHVYAYAVDGSGNNPCIYGAIILNPGVGKTLSGVPSYDWYLGCSPTSAAMALKYDYPTRFPSDIDPKKNPFLIQNLANKMGTMSGWLFNGATIPIQIPVGIIDTCSMYGFSVTSYNGGIGRLGSTFSQYKTEINNNHPTLVNLAFSTATAPSYPWEIGGFGNHSMCGIGYYQYSDGGQYLIVYDTAADDGQVWVNFNSSSLGTNLWTYIH